VSGGDYESSDTQVFTATELFGQQRENFIAFHLREALLVVHSKGCVNI